jgi:hypothetical protein
MNECIVNQSISQRNKQAIKSNQINQSNNRSIDLPANQYINQVLNKQLL